MTSNKKQLAAFAGAGILIALLLLACSSRNPAAARDLSLPARGQDAASLRTPVVGNLGGVPVKIPFEFAELVEYDGEPTNWGQRPYNPPPPRTLASGIKSFGFYVKYPDMTGPTTLQMHLKEKGTYMDEGSPWMSVGINSGDIFPGTGFLDRAFKANIEYRGPSGSEWERLREYAKLPAKFYGLTVYVPPGIDGRTGRPRRESRYAKEIYVDFDGSGKVRTLIECEFNRLGPYCKHNITMEPKMKADVTIAYAQEDLKDWVDIEEKVRTLIASFVIRPSEGGGVSSER